MPTELKLIHLGDLNDGNILEPTLSRWAQHNSPSGKNLLWTCPPNIDDSWFAYLEADARFEARYPATYKKPDVKKKWEITLESDTRLLKVASADQLVPSFEKYSSDGSEIN